MKPILLKTDLKSAFFAPPPVYTLVAEGTQTLSLLEKWAADTEKMEMDGTPCAEQQTSCP